MDYPVFDLKPAYSKIQKIHAAVHSQKAGLNRFGFRNGYLGISVFCYLYSLHTGQSTYVRQSSKYFDLACETINIDPAVSYPLDFSDLGIVSQYLVGAGVLDLAPNVFLEDVDKFLLKKMRFEIMQNNLSGFSTGAAGYGLYFLHRANYDPQQCAIILSEFIPALRGSGLYGNADLDRRGAVAKQNHLGELNLSCGICSVILLLSKMVESGWTTDNNISGIMDTLIHFVFLKYDALEDFKKIICFQDGDLGIGYALLRAGQVLNRPLYSEKGEQILEQCANALVHQNRRLPNSSMLNGSAGAALVFEKAYQLTDKDLFNGAAEFCFRSILEFDAEQGDILPLPQPDLSFMKGISGTGAGLIKALGRDRIDFGELLWLI